MRRRSAAKECLSGALLALAYSVGWDGDETIEGLCLGLLRPQYEGCTQMGATHFKQVMEELEGIPSRTQTHWQAGI